MAEKKDKRTRRVSRIPETKIARLSRLGVTAGAFALGGLAEGARRLVGAGRSTGNVFLNAASATALAQRLAKMRGAAMKLGQLLSMQGDDLVPPEFAAALALLRDSADTMPVAQLRGILGREWGKGWEEKFSRFDMEPLAAASIGQVHSARTKDGRELALKIQYPGVAKSIDSDLDSLAAMLKITRVIPMEVDAKGILAEAKRQLKTEADYVEEAKKLRRYRELVAKAEPDCIVPRVHDDLSTPRILAMDRIEGEPIESLADEGVPQEERDRIGTIVTSLTMHEVFEWHFVQTDPNFANFYLTPDGKLALFDLGGARDYEPELVEQFRHLLRANFEGDRAAIKTAMIEIGFLSATEPADRAEAVVEMIALMGEPLRHRGRYDFGESDLAARVHSARIDLVLHKRFVRAPPATTIFLLRKLVGAYFLCTKVKARVDMRKIAAPWAGARE